MIELIYEPETWVAVAFVIFVGILIKLGVPNMLLKHLDDRSARIKAELDEALKLRKEAEGVLAEYRRKQGEAEKVAESIILNARSEAERLAAEAKAKVEDFIARRTKMAETKIAQAEAQALA
ncbi:MAG TPA: ATP F0F1 synthase subunit B, partial [Stellaceae bacterium]|nr:ATP F0F1 synthase subunit B [Stellaceae bacterium]